MFDSRGLHPLESKVFVSRILIEAGRRLPPTFNYVRDAPILTLQSHFSRSVLEKQRDLARMYCAEWRASGGGLGHDRRWLPAAAVAIPTSAGCGRPGRRMRVARCSGGAF